MTDRPRASSLVTIVRSLEIGYDDAAVTVVRRTQELQALCAETRRPLENERTLSFLLTRRLAEPVESAAQEEEATSGSTRASEPACEPADADVEALRPRDMLTESAHRAQHEVAVEQRLRSSPPRTPMWATTVARLRMAAVYVALGGASFAVSAFVARRLAGV